MSTACTTNATGSGDVLVGSSATAAGASIGTLTFDMAELTGGTTRRFPDGNYCLKARLHVGATDSFANRLALTLMNDDAI